jgi:pimeloyl-ACP methyl ester carboxylesterase
LEIKSAADFVRMSRGALAAAGFVRHERDGRVWWESVDVVEKPREAGPGEGSSSETLLLIHGANDHAGTWFAVAPALAKRFRVVIPDLAGHGESAPASGPIPISRIIEQLEAIDGDALTLVGNSLGGWMALLFALRNPGRVQRLVLEASGGLTRPLGVPLIARDRAEAEVILRAVHGPRYVAPEWVVEALLQRASDSPMLRLTELLEHEVETRLGEIPVPATLVWGADDGVLPLAYAEELCGAIPGAKLKVIEAAAHIPHLQQPGRFLECLSSIF